MAIRQATELIDADPEFVSIVDKGASRRTWKVFKRDHDDSAEDAQAQQGLIAGLRARYAMIRKMLLDNDALPDESPAPDAVGFVVFDKAHFDVDAARAWVRKHDYTLVAVEDLETLVRCKVADVDETAMDFRAETVETGVGVFYCRPTQKADMATGETPDAAPTSDTSAEDRAALEASVREVLGNDLITQLVDIAYASPDTDVEAAVAAALVPITERLVALVSGDEQVPDGDEEGDMTSLKSIEEGIAALTTKFDAGFSALTERVTAVEAGRTAPTRKGGDDETVVVPEAESAVAAEVPAAAEAAAAEVPEAEAPAEDAVQKQLTDIMGAITSMSTGVEKGFSALDARVKKIEGRVVTRKGGTETSTMESVSSDGAFRGLFPWDRAASE